MQLINEKSQSTQRTFLIEVPWVIYLASFVVTMFYLGMVFNDVFKRWYEYLILFVFWIIITVILGTFSQKWSILSLKISLFISGLINSLLWFLFAFQLPVSIINPEICLSWDCSVQSNFFKYCNSWICQFPGVLIFIIINLGLLPILLINWRRKFQPLSHSKDMISSLLIISILLIGLGISYIIRYYGITYLMGIIWLIFSLCFLIFSKLPFLNTFIIPNSFSTRKFSINLMNFWTELIPFVGVVFYGFALLNKNTMNFDLILRFGLGVGLSVLIYTSAKILENSKSKIYLIIISQIMQMVIYFVFLVVMILAWHVYSNDSSLPSDVGISPIHIGCMYGYFCQRILLLTSGVHFPESTVQIRIPSLIQSKIDPVLISSIFIAFLGLGFLQIKLDSTLGYVIFAPGLVLSLLGLLLSMINMRNLTLR
jgi:hypothetical protein